MANGAPSANLGTGNVASPGSSCTDRAPPIDCTSRVNSALRLRLRHLDGDEHRSFGLICADRADPCTTRDSD
jgi:hypothetical protein